MRTRHCALPEDLACLTIKTNDEQVVFIVCGDEDTVASQHG